MAKAVLNGVVFHDGPFKLYRTFLACDPQKCRVFAGTLVTVASRWYLEDIEQVLAKPVTALYTLAFHLI